MPGVFDSLKRVEPANTAHARMAVPLDDLQGLVSDHFGSAPYFALLRIRRSNSEVEQCDMPSNPFRLEERKKGLHVANWLIDQKTDVVLTKEGLDGRGPWFALRDAGIEIGQADGATLNEVLERYFSGSREGANSPRVRCLSDTE